MHPSSSSESARVEHVRNQTRECGRAKDSVRKKYTWLSNIKYTMLSWLRIKYTMKSHFSWLVVLRAQLQPHICIATHVPHSGPRKLARVFLEAFLFLRAQIQVFLGLRDIGCTLYIICSFYTSIRPQWIRFKTRIDLHSCEWTNFSCAHPSHFACDGIICVSASARVDRTWSMGSSLVACSPTCSSTARCSGADRSSRIFLSWRL